MKPKKLNRRKFFTLLGAGSAALAAKPLIGMASENEQAKPKPSTNIRDASKTPRVTGSMPGKYPGKVIMVKNPAAVVNDQPVEAVAYAMLSKAMLELTGQKSLKKAWRQFVNPNEKIGLKVNPVAGKELSTSHAVVKSIVKQLTESGIKKENIIIWDRRDMELKDVGFTSENYPGIKITGTEFKDENGSFYDKDGKLYGERNIDKEWYYWADCESEYDSETLPYMINTGKYSYFTKIVTQEVDKIINIPILKNAGGSVTNAMKNLAFGVISNTGRLHAQLWNDTCAEVCAFAPVRDKVVLNITDGLRGCFNGGPGANPQFICNYNTLLVGSDPVAMDRIAYDIIAAKRVEQGLLKAPNPAVLTFLKMASDLGLGIQEKEKIELKSFDLS
jgi:type IV pilus biogenesis protein CpaD/CtpE